MGAVLNWTTEAKLEQMAERGWVERDRREVDGRIVVTLNHAADRVDTHRSLPLSVPESAPLTLF